MPKRYKLLKDLPGCQKGTVFALDTSIGSYDVEAGNGSTWYPRYRAAIVEESPDWFALISDEPERPYPLSESYKHQLAAAHGPRIDVSSTSHNHAEFLEPEWWATINDARLALRGLPLYHAAVKAILNRKGWEPRAGDHVWRIELTGGCFQPVLCTYGTSMYPHAKPADSDDLTEGTLWPLDNSDITNPSRDASRVCDLFNFFLSTHHE